MSQRLLRANINRVVGFLRLLGGVLVRSYCRQAAGNVSGGCFGGFPVFNRLLIIPLLPCASSHFKSPLQIWIGYTVQ